MSIALEIDNFASINIKEVSELGASTLAGATTLTPKNIQGFASGDFLLISRPGKEICEKRTITIAGANITVAALSFDHQKYAQLNSIFGDQIKVYRAPNVTGYIPDDSAFAQVGSLLTIEVDQLSTLFTDPTGSKDYWYKYTYYNSASLTETNLADSVATRGGGFGNYATIDQIRAEAGFGNNPNITSAKIDERRVNAEEEINSYLGGTYAVPFADPVPAVINNITRLLAAGFLLQEQYGPFTNATALGDKKVKDARALMASVKSGGTTLQDALGNSLKVLQTVNMYPNAQTVDTITGENDFYFKHDQIF